RLVRGPIAPHLGHQDRRGEGAGILKSLSGLSDRPLPAIAGTEEWVYNPGGGLSPCPRGPFPCCESGGADAFVNAATGVSRVPGGASAGSRRRQYRQLAGHAAERVPRRRLPDLRLHLIRAAPGDAGRDDGSRTTAAARWVRRPVRRGVGVI